MILLSIWEVEGLKLNHKKGFILVDSLVAISITLSLCFIIVACLNSKNSLNDCYNKYFESSSIEMYEALINVVECDVCLNQKDL